MFFQESKINSYQQKKAFAFFFVSTDFPHNQRAAPVSAGGGEVPSAKKRPLPKTSSRWQRPCVKGGKGAAQISGKQNDINLLEMEVSCFLLSFYSSSQKYKTNMYVLLVNRS